MNTKQSIPEQFRDRLERVIDHAGVTRSAFARKIGIDRSTLSQILSPANDRLPRVETLAAIASAEQVSVDWLIGLTEQGALKTDILEQSLAIEPGGLSPLDQRLASWHAEAAGYKIRHVPATLPDLLKVDEVIEYEYRFAAVASPEQRRETSEARLEYQRRPETDTEVCSSRQSVESFALGHGVWSGLPAAARRKQVERMVELGNELYPRFRWFFFDGRARFSVPMTIFGPKRAAIYIGQAYLVLNGAEHIRTLAHHFDNLIRAAVVEPTQVVEFLSELLAEL